MRRGTYIYVRSEDREITQREAFQMLEHLSPSEVSRDADGKYTLLNRRTTKGAVFLKRGYIAKESGAS
jgi:hypothetical protein